MTATGSPQRASTPTQVAVDYRPGTAIHPPSGAKARARANLDAIGLVHRLDGEGRTPTTAEQDVLARWSGWGAVPQIFEAHRAEWAGEHAELRGLLSEVQYRAASANTLNAHYTDPTIVAAVWDSVVAAGFTGGRVLEPGSGVGTFLGLAPASATMVGVELDPITARISAHLYPSAQIRQEGFEKTRVPENSFSATVGNVPFGAFALHDPAHNPGNHTIHNHFLLKSVALTAPGGYVAAITSHFTLDAANPKARRDLAEAADLVGAIRLPTKAFDRVSGTTVVTDLIILRKREQGQAPAVGQDWIDTTTVAALDTDGQSAETTVNTYFAAHPENVLGGVHLGHGMYNAATLEVRGDTGAVLAAQVAERLAVITTEAKAQGLGLSATADSATTIDAAVFHPGLIIPVSVQAGRPLDTLAYDEDTASLRRWDGQEWVAHPGRAGKIAETRTLLELRDLATTLIRAQRDGLVVGERDQLRGELNRVYDHYVAVHGAVNRFTWTNPKPITADKHDQRMGTFEEQWRKKEGLDGQPYPGPVPEETRAAWDERAWQAATPSKRFAHLDGGIRNDPGFATVAALEFFDEDTQTAAKAPIFATDVLSRRPERTSAATVEEALAISLDESRVVDVTRIAALLGAGEADTRAALVGKVYPDPTDATRLIPAATYLSGNVRRTLAAAETAAAQDPVYAGNVEALRAVLPRTIEAGEIGLRPGVPWIPTSDYEAFVTEVLAARDVSVDYTLGTWTIDVPKWQCGSPLMTDVYGTGAVDAVSLLESVCNSKPIQVRRSKAEIERTGGNPVDMPATFAAQAQAQARKLSEKFTEWVWSDPDRTARLVGTYNEKFNSLRPARYDGAHLNLPGLGDHFTPHAYQRDAVARIIAEPTVLLDHVVGAGKTGSMFMGAMELKRLGLASQPWIVVPNHIIEQVGREAKQWYPAANVLVGAGATNAEGRRRFAAQTATGDWDMVIVPKSVFTAIKVSPQRQQAHLETARNQLEEAKKQAGVTNTKQIETAIKDQDKRLAVLTEQAGKDTGLTWEMVGADYIFLDEAHYFKNRERVSAVRELACTPGSQQAEDLVMKLDVLRESRRDAAAAAGYELRPGQERVATFSTGTPVANSLGEMWVMQSYLRPDLLADAGVADVDGWGAVFTGTTASVEMNASGSRLAPVTRVGRFVNVPELVTMSSVYTDVVTREYITVALPELVGGARQVISKPASQEVRDFISDLAYRSEHFDPGRPDIDNSLKVANDGRNVSLDERMANLEEPLDGGRIGMVAAEIMRVHADTATTTYRDQAGAVSPVAGGLQIVFCDRSTPHQTGGKFSLYEGLRAELVERGMVAEAIRFIHDYPKPGEKAQLFQDCRAGRVSVLVGSTEKMGTGTNIQDRAVALHHVDVPWRPADLEQREGRILRQGNQNPRVEILNYVTEQTWDTIMWQTVEKKARFIGQIKTGDLDARTAEDLGSDELGNSAAATKAVATGDPRYLQQVQLDDDVKRLSALRRAHGDAKARNAAERRACGREVTATGDQLAQLDTALPRIAASADAPFAMSVGGRAYRERGAASSAVVDTVRQAYSDGKRWGAQKEFPVASLRGVEVRAARLLTSDEVVLSLSIPCRTRAVAAKDFTGRDANGVGLVRRIENMVNEIPAYCGELQHRQDRARTRTEELLAVADAPFEHEADLVGKEHELAALTAQLHVDADSPQAHARAEETRQRLATQGRTPGWSLVLNPTPALLKEMGEASAGPTTTRELVTAGVPAPGAAAGAQEVSPDVSAARDAVRLAGLSHPRSVEEQLADRRDGGTANGDGSPEWTPHRGREEERGR